MPHLAVFNDMRDQLRETTHSRDYVDSILSGMNEAIIVTSADGTILRINTATRHLLGYEDMTIEELVQSKIADMVARTEQARLLVYRLGRMKDAGTMQPTQVSIAKWNNVRMALDIARDCRDILGGSGITTEYQAIRHMLNLESVITYEGTETVHQLVIGKELTGVNAFG